MAVSNIAVACFLGGVPLIGSVTSLLSAKIVEKFGHRFTQMGLESSPFVAIMGVVQNTVALAVAIFLEEKPKKSIFKEFFIAHLITGALLFGLTALAARVNLIASGLSVPGTALLMATGFAGTILVFGSAKLVEKYEND